MAIYKISFLLSSPTVKEEYKAAKNADLIEDLAKAVASLMAPAKPLHVSPGDLRHHFFAASESDVERIRADVNKKLAELVPEERLRRSIIFCIVKAPPEEINSLMKTNSAAFAEAVQEGSSADDTKGFSFSQKGQVNADLLKKRSMELSSLWSGAKAAQEVQASEEKAPSQGGHTTPLSSKIEKLEELRALLLEKVHGQRHAVDQVVQGIFESETFADNPHRKGPLATFLFAGPSGVGKTLLATLTGEVLNRKTKIIDMSEYTDPFANVKFNGERGQPNEVTGFVQKYPDGILIFDEIEKAHIDTIYLFLQILDGARMMDHKLGHEVSFRDNIIIMTTNAGAELYEDPTVCNLSSIPRNVILNALRKSDSGRHRQTSFPESITTRMAYGRVVMFNHLEPFALREIVQDEIDLQMDLFEKSTGIHVNYDPEVLSALLLYTGGGVSDARTLQGLARTTVSRELQEMVTQLFSLGKERIDGLKEITVSVDTHESDEVGKLFHSLETMKVAVLTDQPLPALEDADASLNAQFSVLSDEKDFKRRIRGLVDYILLDPLCGRTDSDRVPNDVEDLDSLGMKMFEYVLEFMPELPVYILDTTGKIRSFDTLLARGAKGVISAAGSSAEFSQKLRGLACAALVNNATFSLGRSNKVLAYNCAQYVIDREEAAICFDKLHLKSAPQAGDSSAIMKKGANTAITFDDVVGCKSAKEALCDYVEMLKDPRKVAEKGKKMPKGVLLYGPPGTGKTLLAKALANESNATFLPATGAGFFAPLVGQTEENIRALFRKARKYAPSIIFIDEIDAIGRNRTGGVNTHGEDALTILLAEMDGFIVDEKRPVFVLAATNYELNGDHGKVLDPALVRRFDQKLLISLPDADDRFILLRRSLERHGIHFGDNHDQILRNMADRTAGMNNADLESINANFARLLGDKEPRGADYMDSLDAYRYGEIKDASPEDLRQTACHEAGHALICRLCGSTPSFLTVVSRGHFGGYMEHEKSEKGTSTYRELMDRVCVSLAGRAAEIEVYGNDSGNNTGASADIRNARHLMKMSLNDFAMGDKLYARLTIAEIEELMQKEYARTRQLIQANRRALDALTDLLVQKKSLDQSELERFFTAMNI